MPFSYTEYTGDGSTTDFAITFDYLDRDHVFVTVAGLKTTDVSSLYEFSFVNDTTVRVVLSADGTSAVPNGDTIRVGRDTNIDNPPVTWTEGAALTTTDLNKLANYLTYALQESLDANEGAALATLAQQAAEAAQALAEAAQSGAETAEINAETAQGLAEAAQTAAEAAQTAAEAAQGLAETARDKAQDWAEELEDVEVETGQYSAFHWAEKASASATAAAASAASIGPDADFDSLTLTPGTGGGDLEFVAATDSDRSDIKFSDQSATDQGFIRYSHSSDRMKIGAGGSELMDIGLNGSTAFQFTMPAGYDNTTFWMWDGGKSTGNSSYLVINGASDGEMGILFGDDEDTADGWVRYDNGTRDLIFGASNGNQMRITAAGRVGIQTSDPECRFHVEESSNGRTWSVNSQTEFLLERGGNCLMSLAANATGASGINFSSPSDEFAGRIFYDHNVDRFRFYLQGNQEMYMTTTGVVVTGSFSKGSGSFKIDHPLKPDTHHLVHSFVEGPQADNIYRGRIDLVNGQATVNLDEASRMTEGTFVALNGNVQCFTSNETGWTAVRGTVDGNILTIEAQSPVADTVSWLVIGERHDQHMIDTDWTDENGRVITEPEKVPEPEKEE